MQEEVIFSEHEIINRVMIAKTDIVAIDVLIKDYLPFIIATTQKTVGRAVTYGIDDEVSIAMLGFHDAVNSYSRIRGSFLKYANVIIKNRIIDYYRKESKHKNVISFDTSINEESREPLIDKIADKTDEYALIDGLYGVKAEIEEISHQLLEFGITITDLSENSPKQDRTVAACHKILQYAKKNPNLIKELKRTKRLPTAELCLGTGIERKTVERHRKYLIALMIIYSNGYELIRDHLRGIFKRTERNM